MKCRSVACIWSDTPPSHRVTATAVLSQPPTLYTGGSDGSIIWWSLSSSDSSSKIKPVAMLCGHAAKIADLGICDPVQVAGNEKPDPSSDVNGKVPSENCGALVSACTDGVLCVWSRRSGHCRRRRKLPAWVGSPSMVRTLSSKPRYLCIGCCFIDSGHLPDYHSVDPTEGSGILTDRESQHRKRPKCTVVIVDTYTLTTVQTVFHGILSVASLKFMEVVSSIEDQEKHCAVMADSFGRVQLVSLPKEPHQAGGSGTGLLKGSQVEMTVWEDTLSEGGHVVSIVTRGNVIAFLLYNCCIFRLLSNGVTIGEISFMENFLCLELDSDKTHVTGGMFLDSGDAGSMMDDQLSHEKFVERFVVWNSGGFAIVYVISYLNDVFQCEPICEIPSFQHSLDVRVSISFIQLNHYLLRLESRSLQVEEPLHWTTNITIWSLHQKHDYIGKFLQQCRMLGEGSALFDWIVRSSLLNETQGQDDGETELGSQKCSFQCLERVNKTHLDDQNYGFVQKRQIVSSSMVISDNFLIPYAVVYGFYSGDIQVVRFNMFQGLSPTIGSSEPEVDSHELKRYFLGHTGPVLCLAAHGMIGVARGWSFKRVLLSGSMDCTIRLWDLDSGNLIMVMHHHVAPVRQIILPPVQTNYPWSDCFLSVGDDSCVALASLETLRVERMFPGHLSYPAKVVWDGARGYIACLYKNHSWTSEALDVLYIWDIKTGARERVLRGTASHSMFDHFCKAISKHSFSGTIFNINTSVSSLLLAASEDGSLFQSHSSNSSKSVATSNQLPSLTNRVETSTSEEHGIPQIGKHPIRCSSPFPGIAALSFDLASLMSFNQKHVSVANDDNNQKNTFAKEHETKVSIPRHIIADGGSVMHGTPIGSIEELDWVKSLEECLLRSSLSFLHLWNVDSALDDLLITDMKLKILEGFIIAPGLQGDKGSLTVTFPGLSAILELWKSSSEFCAMRSLTMVSLAQHMISLSHSGSAASSSLAAFYTRNIADKVPDIVPPSLQLLVSFWQDESEHVRMAARSLFHCAASRAIPLPLCGRISTEHRNMRSPSEASAEGISHVEECNIRTWLESFEMQDWISCVGGTSQDAMTSHIIVAAALAIWYPSLVNPSLSALVVHPLVKLVTATNEKYSSAAAELLAEGMESTWKVSLGSEITRLIEDIFFQIECVSGPSPNSSRTNVAVPLAIKETLVGVLLPSLAMADIPSFLSVIERQIWSTASDSPVHLVSLMTLIRLVRGCPRILAQYLDKVVSFILQTMDPSNSVMRKTCFQSSMIALKEVVYVFPMVALNDSWTRLAVGDVIGETNNASIRVYDVQSVVKIKVLDASGPPGLPSLLPTGSETMMTTAISALSFSPDGEGVVAFSEHGLMIRWWSLGSVWWEKLSRNFVPVQCTKVIFVPPWEGFSPNSSRTSIMASIMGHDEQANLQDKERDLSHADSLKLLIHNLDLYYRLEWVGARKVVLSRYGQELGTFQF